MDFASPITRIRGIGGKTEALFQKLGVYTVGDLLTYYPRDYRCYDPPVRIGDVGDQEFAAIQGTVTKNATVKPAGRMQLVLSQVADESGVMELKWFNMAFLRNFIKKGTSYVFYGQVKREQGRLTMVQPQYFDHEQYGRKQQTLEPMYALTAGLGNQSLGKFVARALADVAWGPDPLPLQLREQYGLEEYRKALGQIHFPVSEETFLSARKRLAFEEFFFFVLRLQLLKGRTGERSAHKIPCFDFAGQILENLPFVPTGAQMRVWGEIQGDFAAGKATERLIQGDVGSGKTLIAVLALVSAAQAGHQGALMAPTEILAKQHFDAIQELLQESRLPCKVALLTGSLGAQEKKQLYGEIGRGDVDIVVGTHALIQEKVSYHSLALVITDEQHRFGVRQRETLLKKGKSPYVLVMSATPIPRTLALILYGDMDISALDEMPGNRQKIKSCAVGEEFREKAYAFLRQEVAAGRQAYVICPLVEEGEQWEVKDVVSTARTLREVMPDTVAVAYLHGRMTLREKERIMEDFLQNEIQILVSTTVIEVGINVPNATVIMIENAERFGLAQLHQLRGRVGRGSHQSYCIFMGNVGNQRTKERLDVLVQSSDGFHIARQDLQLRGLGDLFGIRQSGLSNFTIGDIYRDTDILVSAAEAAGALLREDPGLEREEHAALAARMERDMAQGREAVL